MRANMKIKIDNLGVELDSKIKNALVKESCIDDLVNLLSKIGFSSGNMGMKFFKATFKAFDHGESCPLNEEEYIRFKGYIKVIEAYRTGDSKKTRKNKLTSSSRSETNKPNNKVRKVSFKQNNVEVDDFYIYHLTVVQLRELAAR